MFVAFLHFFVQVIGPGGHGCSLKILDLVRLYSRICCFIFLNQNKQNNLVLPLVN